MGVLRKFLAQNLDCFYMLQTTDALEEVDLKLVPRGGIKLPIQVFLRDFVAM